MDYTCIFFGVLFIIAGTVFALGKGHIYLTAWKNMPQKEKEKIKIGPLCRNVGEMMILNGVIFLTKGIWPAFDNRWFVWAMILWLIAAGLDVCYISKSRRYRNQ
ncbi:MAG: DUF3784 domain-containing protein [Massiliimalia sp.]|jgi:hypothetical protein